MTGRKGKLVLWAGAKHSGKTAAVLGLAQQVRSAGFSVAGLAAPAVYEEGRLTGFDAVDLCTSRRAALARNDIEGPQRIGAFGFAREGLAFGREALGRPAELVIVDEFGPLELRGGGWRGAVETLLTASAGVVLLVVRDGLVEEVRRLYSDQQPVVTPAAGLDAASTVIDMLKCGRA